MKTLIALTISGLFGTLVFAQSAPPTAMKTASPNQIYNSGTLGNSGRPLITTDQNQIYKIGGQGNDAVARFTLKKGHYIVGAESHDKDETHSLFVNPSANDPDKYMALYIENNVFRNDVGTAQIMIGAPTSNGKAIQFSPARIGLKGSLEDVSTLSHARVLLISRKAQTEEAQRFPYMVKGTNGLTNNQMLGMRGAESNIDLRVEALSNIFTWENNRRDKVVVDERSLTEYSTTDGLGEYEMFNLNNEFGAFYALTSTAYNTHTTETASQTDIEKFAIFLGETGSRQSQSKDCMLIASPRGLDQLAVKLYTSPKNLGFFQKLFGQTGRLDPKPSKNKFFNN